MNFGRIAAAVVVAGAALCVIESRGCRSQTATGRARESGQPDDGLSRTRSAVSSSLIAADVVQPGELSEDVNAVLDAIVQRDGANYYKFWVSRGGVFLRRYADGLVDDWNSKQIVQTRSTVGLSDVDTVSLIWGTSDARRMAIVSIRPESTRAGRGATIHLQAPDSDWPFNGAQFSSSLFSPPSGRFSEALGTELDGTAKSAHVTIEGSLRDGTRVWLRLHFFYTDKDHAWFPVTIAAASDDKTYWPWPVS